ncbi:E3 ubiquitin-protein ligase TRIM35-like [Festucalex cinctus]
MASRVEDNLQCPTCFEIFKDPVMLPCSHSFCRACLQQWWEQKMAPSCPVCRKRCRSMDVPSNLALKNVCEAFSEATAKSGDHCKLHKEKLELFCLDHQESVCIDCRGEETHAGHKFRPIHEIVDDHREELQKALRDMKAELEEYNRIRDNWKEQAEYIKIQRDQVERKIRKDFEVLRHFLEVEEAAMMSAVREEEQKKSRILKEKIKALKKDMAALSDVIRSTEEQLTFKQTSSLEKDFVKNYKTALTRIQELPKKPKPIRGALLDEAKHVGNLKFSVWERMKETVSYSPVILNPNTASPALSLSEDLTCVSFRGAEQRPNNPERLYWNGVLGSALDSGTNIWDVEVGDNMDWELGVVWEDPSFLDSTLKCTIGLCDEYTMFRQTFLTCTLQPFGSPTMPVRLQKIRVHVDTNERSISFSDSLTNTELCKESNVDNWPNLSGEMKMCPYFYTTAESPLKIIPLRPRVTNLSQ